MISFEYIDCERIAVFMEKHLGSRGVRIGTIYSLKSTTGDYFQYVTGGGRYRGKRFKSLQECKDSITE